MDPNNPVVKFCATGIGAEMAGRRDEAAKLYQDAWNARTNDYESCIAAHYMARLQVTAGDALRWNSEALRFAESANEDDLRSFLPSLYLNLGKSHEDLKNFAEAKKFYLLAQKTVGVLSEGEYAETVARGIRGGLERIASREKRPRCSPLRVAFAHKVRAGRLRNATWTSSEIQCSHRPSCRNKIASESRE